MIKAEDSSKNGKRYSIRTYILDRTSLHMLRSTSLVLAVFLALKSSVISLSYDGKQVSSG